MGNPAATIVRIPRRRSRKIDPAHPVYEIDLWLVDSEPLIWRSLAVSADLTLDGLHRLIQVVMEWKESHLHQFETRSGRRFEPATPVGGVDAMWGWLRGDDRESEDEARITVRNIFEDLKQTVSYLYDFGDSWEHGIKLVDTHADRCAFAQLPVCLGGAHAGPPEDSGGVWGYREKLEIMRNPDPNDEWHRDVMEWIGGARFDPEAFDIAARNRRISAAWSRLSTLSASGNRRCGTKQRKRKSR